MSYNGSGTFNINTTGQPVVAGTVISSSAFNSLTNDLAIGLTTAITKDGQTTTTARITFAQGLTSSLVTDSSSISTGSIITGGGVGIAKALYVGTTANVAGAVTLGGIATFSAQPIFSSLTASSAVATDASKGLISVTNTGTGNNVLATSPTLVTPALGTPSALVLTNATGLPAAQLTGTQTLPKGTLPTGSVLQVINTTYATATSTASSSLVDTGLSASITPSSTSSKVLVFVNLAGLFSNSGTVGQFTITDGSNNILLNFEGLTGYQIAASLSYGEAGTNYLHSPATTSSFTYKVRMKNVAGSGISINAQTSGVSTSTITLMEIAA